LFLTLISTAHLFYSSIVYGLLYLDRYYI